MTSQLAFDFTRSKELSAAKAARARAAIAKYRALVSDEDITGRETDILALLRRRTIKEPQRHVVPEKRHGRSLDLPPARFHEPRPPRGRPRTADGRQSFHFELSTVTKGVDGVCRTNDGRTADPVGHVGYVGREDAVATGASAEAHEAVKHVGYVSRDAAVAIDGDGAAIVLTNIEGEPAAFFAAVVDHERSGHSDGICLADPLDIPALHALTQSATIPPQLKAGIERVVADPGAHRVEKSGSPKSRSHPFQVDAEIFGCAAWLRKHGAGQVHLREGRGGIVQRRITGELPAELGATGCRRVLEKLAEQFERRGLRYYAALHAPTAANHDRNWHFHLLYYDRPCDRIDGAWDFTIADERRTSSRNRTRSYPHRQPKHPDVAKRTWPMQLRTHFAGLVNAELAAVSSARRYDPRPYNEMAIDAEAQEHLAPRAAFHAACGAAPEKDRENARKGWSWRLRQLLLRHDQIEKEDAERIADLRSRIRQDAQDRDILAKLERDLAERRAEARTGAVLLEILHPMARSNAEQTAEKMKGYAADLADKLRAKGKDPAHHLRHEAFRQRGREAESYLAELERAFAPEVQLAVSLVVGAQIAREQMDVDLVGLRDRSTARSAIDITALTAAAPPSREALGTDATTKSASTTPPTAPSPPAQSQRTVASQVIPATSEEVDDWLGRIVRNRRRLTLRDGRVVPMQFKDIDGLMLSVASPPQLKELARIRDQQNRLIDRIAGAVKAAPGILSIPSDAGGKWTIAHPAGDIQDGLRRYIIDPAVQERLRSAQEAGQALQAASQLASPSRIHRAVDQISKAGVAIRRQGETFTISDAAAARLGITPEELQPEAVQRRLSGMLRTPENVRAPVTFQGAAPPQASDDLRPERHTAQRTVTPLAPEPPRNAPDARATPASPAAAPVPVQPPAPAHPFVASWHEAHMATIRPGGTISIAERNRRAAVALKETLAAEELRRLGPDVLAAATAHAAENRIYLQRAAAQVSPHPRIG